MAATIACIGFGSLIWEPAKTPGGPLEAQGVVRGRVEDGGSWRGDGPALPLELARAETYGARDEPYLAWVVVPGAPRSPSLWTTLALPHAATLERALALGSRALAERESAALLHIGRWPVAPGERPQPEAEHIAAWVRRQGVDGAIWTALPPRWRDLPRVPPLDDALAWLHERVARGEAAHARDYVERTPAQIASPLRDAIARELGWQPRARSCRPSGEPPGRAGT